MAVRETINQHPGIASGVTIGLIVIAVIVIGMQLRGTSGTLTEAWFTTDDSSPEAAVQALFVDDANKLPPFEKDGKKAYRAHVFTCDNGKTRFVAYLERFTEPARARMEQFQAQGMETVDSMELDKTLKIGVEVKAPGSGPWIMQANEAAEQFMLPMCPDRASIPQPVVP